MKTLHEKFRRSLDYAYQGFALGTAIFALWLCSLWAGLSLDLETSNAIVITLAMLLQAFLYTGLFITAHDAMHGLLAPRHKRLNDVLGALGVFLYALLSFRKLRNEHHRHHARPGGAHDPDFHDGEHKNFWAWYVHFMRSYVTWRQIAGMALAFNLMHHLLHVPVRNLILFWATPALLSTLQLFYFGTFLPHRETETGYADRHHTHSNDFSVLWSFLTCYHFGYHWEHHEFPYVPWWKLPSVRKALRAIEAQPHQ